MREFNPETGELEEYRPRMRRDREAVVSEISNVEDLLVIEQEEEERVAVYLESEVLEGLVGFNCDEVMSRIDLYYDTEFAGKDYDSFEYGNGWALIRNEE